MQQKQLENLAKKMENNLFFTVNKQQNLLQLICKVIYLFAMVLFGELQPITQGLLLKNQSTLTMLQMYITARMNYFLLAKHQILNKEFL
jgi:hypothetical protein